jgi:hypothetical protein
MDSTHCKARADFHLCKRRGRKISGGVQAAPLSELRQGLGVWVKAFHKKIGGVKRNFGGVEHFIGGVREILGGRIHWGEVLTGPCCKVTKLSCCTVAKQALITIGYLVKS